MNPAWARPPLQVSIVREGGLTLRRCLRYVTVACCALLYLYPFTRFVSGGEDQGSFINGAVRVTEGQVPLRDFFEVTGPGSFYWLAMFLKLFGTNWLATRISLMFTTVAVILLVYYLSRRSPSKFDSLPTMFLLAVSMPVLPSISHHLDSNFFALLSFVALLSWLEDRRPVMILLTGVLAGVTTCFPQPKGLLLLLSCALTVWLLRRGDPGFLPSMAQFLGGYLTVGIFTVLLYWKAGGLADLIYANVVWPLTNYNRVNVVPYGHGLRELFWNSWAASLTAVFSPVPGYGLSGILILPALILLALPVLLVLFGLRYGSLAFTPEMAPYWPVGSAQWISEIHRKDMYHLIYGSPILAILCFRLYRPWVNHNVLKFVTLSANAAVGFNGLVAVSAQRKTVTRRGPKYTYGHPDAVLEFLNAHTSLGEEIFVYPYRPIYHFLSATRNPTRFGVLLYQFNTEPQFAEVIRSLERSKVRYVVWDRGFAVDMAKGCLPSYRQPREEHLIMEPYLTEHYTVVEKVNGFQILERRELPIRSADAASAIRYLPGQDQIADNFK